MVTLTDLQLFARYTKADRSVANPGGWSLPPPPQQNKKTFSATKYSIIVSKLTTSFKNCPREYPGYLFSLMGIFQNPSPNQNPGGPYINVKALLKTVLDSPLGPFLHGTFHFRCLQSSPHQLRLGPHVGLSHFIHAMNTDTTRQTDAVLIFQTFSTG